MFHQDPIQANAGPEKKKTQQQKSTLQSKAAPAAYSAARILQMQRTLGNQAVGRLLSSMRQPKAAEQPIQRKTLYGTYETGFQENAPQQEEQKQQEQQNSENAVNMQEIVIQQETPTLDTLALSPSERVKLSKYLRDQGKSDLLSAITAEWINANRDYSGLIAEQSKNLASLMGNYELGLEDPKRLQAQIYKVVSQYVEAVIAGTMANFGLDSDEFAILMVGSAARKEMFPASDIDLLLLSASELDEGVTKAIDTDIKSIISSVVTQAVELLGWKGNSEDKEPFSLDACLVGKLIHTPNKAVNAAVKGGGSNDNMMADTVLVNQDSKDANFLYDSFQQGYNKELDGKKGQMRRGFLPERIMEMRDKIQEAEKQLYAKNTGFNVKTGLLRPPSLLARDYYTWRGDPTSDPQSTEGRLQSFLLGEPETQLSGKSVDGLQSGFDLGTRLRMELRVESKSETDVLPQERKKQEEKNISTSLGAYIRAINEMLKIAEHAKLAPRPANKVDAILKGSKNADEDFAKLQKTGMKPSKNGGCFLTTACTAARGLPDDCAELTALRAYRDGWLSAQPEGEALISRYYHIAPQIVESVDSSAEAPKVWEDVYQRILACIADIDASKPESALARYREMVLTLERRFVV